jgi:RNA polymerase sigma factor (sigma-70 family)
MANGQIEAVLTPEPTQGLADAGMVAQVSDGQLLARFACHRDELAEIAFAALVHRHGPMVLRVCQQILGDRHTAEDAFQATFLVLARRAGSIRQPELLGNWLHGVALRTAREARMRDDRRRRRETPRSEGIAGEPSGEAGRPDELLVRREEFEALHEEVSRLPDRYRVPVLLCELEGLSYQEAALRMRCPVGTISVRLRRARERLRVRLTGRGLAPTTGLLGALFGADAASAHVPPVLVDSTVQAAMGFAASKAAGAGLVSASVATLTGRVLRVMALARLKLIIGLALAVGITMSVSWIGAQRGRQVAAPARQGAALPGGETPPAVQPAAPEQAEPRPWEEVPPPGNPIASALAAQSDLGRMPGARIEFALTLLDVLFNSNRGEEPEIVKDLRGKGSKPDPEVVRGEVLFAKEWVSHDPMSHGGDGLGPVYNETSCVACHGLGGPGGAGPENKNVVLVTATRRGRGVAKGLDQIHPGFRGSNTAVLHRFGTDPEYGSWRTRFFESRRDEEPSPASAGCAGPTDSIGARIQAIKEQVAPDRRLRDRLPRLRPANGFNLTLSERNTPALFGAGLIDSIPSEVLVEMARSQPEEVQGRVSRTADGRIGRFGWKAQIASLHEFVRGACANELGLEVPGHSQARSPLTPSEKAKGLDMTEEECDALAAYIRALPAPVVIDPDGPHGNSEIREGRRLFAEVGCTSCHVPTLGDVRGIYSDLLLHDMGQSTSDSGSSYGTRGPISPGGPIAGEWRTPPLWGYRDSGPYLHDGRAQNLEEAVAHHEGQGGASARRFITLSARERSQIEAFLKSLVAPASAAAAGVVLAAEMESRFEAEEPQSSEAQVRRQREEAVARDEQQWKEAHRRRRAETLAKRAQVQFPLAVSLEKMGKVPGALGFYREIARLAPETEEGRRAAARISALELVTRTVTP